VRPGNPAHVGSRFAGEFDKRAGGRSAPFAPLLAWSPVRETPLRPVQRPFRTCAAAVPIPGSRLPAPGCCYSEVSP
jgi:hypothetical protein